jgi:hypothetical protein
MAAQHIDTNALVTMAVVDGRPSATASSPTPTASSADSAGNPEPHFIGIQMVNTSVFAGVDPDVSQRPSVAYTRR